MFDFKFNRRESVSCRHLFRRSRGAVIPSATFRGHTGPNPARVFTSQCLSILFQYLNSWLKISLPEWSTCSRHTPSIKTRFPSPEFLIQLLPEFLESQLFFYPTDQHVSKTAMLSVQQDSNQPYQQWLRLINSNTLFGFHQFQENMLTLVLG